jgi:cyclopropane-fatty-acyl-phospholipid synthase
LDHSVRYGTLVLDVAGDEPHSFGHGEPVIGLSIRKPAILPRLIANPELVFGEAYMRGDLEMNCDIEDVIQFASRNYALASHATRRWFASLSRLAHLTVFSVKRQRQEVSHHYDLGNDFYRLWLDPTMTYSCAYFLSSDDPLETAQRRKIQHSLNKLNLAPDETLLDIGCGWGSVLVEAETQYGVVPTGITLSEEQKRYFDERKMSERPDIQAKIELKHYHSLAEEGAPFDKVISIGMVEHIGKQYLPLFFADLKKLLKPGGLGLVHCITGIEEGETNPWIEKYIFPGGYIPSIQEVIHELTQHGMTIWDVENIGPHYALTLDRWADNFERNADQVTERYGEEFVRMWRFYLRSCAANFRTGHLFVHQMLVSNGAPKRLPLSRSFWPEDSLETSPPPNREAVPLAYWA